MSNKAAQTTKSMKSELDQIQKTFKTVQLNHQRYCEHHDDAGYWFRQLNEMKGYRFNNEYPESAARCLECGRIFDVKAYTKEETEEAVWMLESILEQLKFIGNLDGGQLDEIVSMLESMSQLKRMLMYYHNLSTKKERERGRNKDRNHSHKSTIGATSSMFNGIGRR